jgi:hypothetical protein
MNELRQMTAHPLLRRALVLALGFCALYLLTTSYTVIIDHDDSAEFQTVGVAGGIAHQPYPLWSILAKTFSLLPIGEPAFRVTLMSILLASLTLGMLFVALVKITGDTLAGLVACIGLGVSHTFWREAVVAEVYSLNAFMLVAAFYCFLRWRETRSRSYWYLFAAMVGFLLSHHQLNVALLPALVLAGVWERESISRELSPRDWLATAFLVALPSTLYLYTFIVDRGDHPMNWLDNFGRYLYASSGNDPREFGGFFERMRFQMFVGRLGPLLPQIGDLGSRLYGWFRHVFAFEFPMIGSLVIAIGFFGAWKRYARWNAVAVVFGGAFAILAVGIGGGVTQFPYSIPVLLCFTAYLAWGIAALRRRTADYGQARRWAAVIVTALIVVIPLAKFSIVTPARLFREPGLLIGADRGGNLFWHLRSSNNRGAVYGRFVAEHVAPQSLVFARWSQANVLLYYKYVRGEMEDCEVSYVLPDKQDMDDLVDELRPDRLYTTYRPEKIGFTRVGAMEILPGGTLYEIIP